MIRHALLLLATACVLNAGPVEEESIVHAETRFRFVSVSADQVGVLWKPVAGEPFGSFENARRHLVRQGKTPVFLTNAGIYQMGAIPCGLHVEDGIERHPLNQADAPGNFFLKPNGVFFIESGKASILRTEDYVLKKPKPALAVQSGPMLLIRGSRHPAFREGSASKLVRNGVGVDDQGRVVFAITDKGQLVNFWDFSGLFLKLGCKDALFLDGDISQMVVNPGETIRSNQFAAMFHITK